MPSLCDLGRVSRFHIKILREGACIGIFFSPRGFGWMIGPDCYVYAHTKCFNMKKEGARGYIYTLELVDAESRVPFPEHSTPDGTKTYAEVEPEAEYLVRVNSRGSNGGRVKLIAELTVDGKVIRKGKHMWTCPKSGFYLGFRSYFDGIKTETSLKFDKVTIARSSSVTDTDYDGDGDGVAHLPVGKVSVLFYEPVLVQGGRGGMNMMPPDTAEAWAGQNFCTNSGAGKKKALKTVSGGTVTGVTEARMSPYRKGKLVESIELNYCTAQGLIHAGIWPKVSAIASASASRDQPEVIDLTDADDMPVKKKARTESVPVDLTGE